MKRISNVVALLAIIVNAIAFAQSQPAGGDKPPMKPEELEQLLAPIALYPDSLLTQMLMASTYPLEIVEADRWAKANKQLKDDALAKELEKQTWDASVKSLIQFPDQLAAMSEQLSTTIKIGDAFIEQQGDVMNTIQVLRNKANKEGNLKSNDSQKVVTEPRPAPTPSTQPVTTVVQPPPQVIKIESPNPKVVYVPTYEPTVVYGTWPYPPPPPYYPPRPPGYVATAAISFGVGMACGAAWGYAWGNSNWGGNDVDIDVNRNTTFNTNIDRSKAQANIDARKTNVQGAKANSWSHDSSHRQGAPYRNKSTQQKYSSANQARTAQARDDFRGRADQGRQNLSRDQASGKLNNLNSGGRDTAGARDAAGARDTNPRGGGAGVENRAAGTAGDRGGAAGGASRGGGGAFEGANRAGSETRAASSRGQTSRSGGSGGGGGSARSGGGGGGGRR
jgi:hypothetical protein